MRALLLTLLLGSAAVTSSSGLPVPNRGTQLFVLITGQGAGTHVIAMTPANRPVLQEWNRYNPTYNFVWAAVRRTADGSKVAFTRYVMADDYIPRVQRLDLLFPYNEQPRYRFFEIGSIIGFYRNSVHDIDPHEFF
jgi:hypothetical protein